MQHTGNILRQLLAILGAAAALQGFFPIDSRAEGPGNAREYDSRWLGSFAVTSGVMFNPQKAGVSSCVFAGPIGSCPPSVPLAGFRPLQGQFDDDDLAVAPFVGGNVEVMTPTLPLPGRPRLFLSGEILPTFADDRDIVKDGDPSCVRGPTPGAPCAVDLTPADFPNQAFGADGLNGQGSVTSAEINTLVFGANVGVSFPFDFLGRRIRIKPSLSWMSYEIEAQGLVVDGDCPTGRCTPTQFIPPPPTTDQLLRQTVLSAKDSRRFNAIGPGIDVEMDTGRLGPIGTSLFFGGRAYHTLGDRDFNFRTRQVFADVPASALGPDTRTAEFEVRVERWNYRVGLGLRLFWLGFPR